MMQTPEHLPRYPIYIPSKGRAKNCETVRCLLRDETPLKIVIEPQEQKVYADRFGKEHLLVLPKNDGGLIFARNWIKAHSIRLGFERHWQLDDNIQNFKRFYRAKRFDVRARIALRVCEDFVDRYTNVAVAGLNYQMFMTEESAMPPFTLNTRVYSCTLVLNAIPHRWRLAYNDDTDLCLQVLADGWCTVLLNAFLANKLRTMRIKGGNTDDLYQGDGRLTMARTLERMWPGVVTTKRRFQRPQHFISDNWKRFDTPLIRKDGQDSAVWEKSKGEYDMKLRLKDPKIGIRSKVLQRWYDEDQKRVEEEKS